MAVRDKELEELRAAAETAKGREDELSKQAADLAKARAGLDLQVQKQIDSERAKLREEAQASAHEEVDARLKAMEADAEESRKKLKAAQEKEFEFLRQKQKFEEQAAELELTITRRLDEERQNIRQETAVKIQEQMNLTVREKDHLIQQMRDQMEGLQRKLDQGSQQAQGEAQELLLEEQLRQAFPMDSFREVAKGSEGADVIQTVRDTFGRDCGTILWESKRTKNWSDNWLNKLQADRAREHATIAALATQAMPRNIAGIGQMEDVWVCAFTFAVPMSMLLRWGMLEEAAARKSLENQQDKMTVLYAYLTGSDFRGRVTAVVHAWNQMLDNLCDERKAMERIWAERQRLLTMAMGSMQGLHSDLQAIAGSEINVLSASSDGIRQLEALANSAADLVDLPVAEPGTPPPAADALFPDVAVPLPAPSTVPRPTLISEERDQREELFLAKLSQIGGRAGNMSLREALGLTESDYDEIKRRLLAKNLIVLGQGRGGSVRLVTRNGAADDQKDE